jgi:hypothetical protein
VLFSIEPKSSCQHIEELIERGQLWPRICSLENCQLLPENYAFKKEEGFDSSGRAEKMHRPGV